MLALSPLRAQTLAHALYRPNETALPEVLQQLNHDTYRLIAFRPEEGLLGAMLAPRSKCSSFIPALSKKSQSRPMKWPVGTRSCTAP
ncbi:MAG: hypothetical protein ABIR29_12095 [Chthoniobacterales bacterium]